MCFDVLLWMTWAFYKAIALGAHCYYIYWAPPGELGFLYFGVTYCSLLCPHGWVGLFIWRYAIPPTALLAHSNLQPHDETQSASVALRASQFNKCRSRISWLCAQYCWIIHKRNTTPQKKGLKWKRARDEPVRAKYGASRPKHISCKIFWSTLWWRDYECEILVTEKHWAYARHWRAAGGSRSGVVRGPHTHTHMLWTGMCALYNSSADENLVITLE